MWKQESNEDLFLLALGLHFGFENGAKMGPNGRQVGSKGGFWRVGKRMQQKTRKRGTRVDAGRTGESPVVPLKNLNLQEQNSRRLTTDSQTGRRQTSNHFKP